MDKYFTPVCGSSDDENKLLRNQQFFHFHHSNQNRSRGLNRSSKDHSRQTDNSHFHHHSYQNHPHNHQSLMSTVPHQGQQNTLLRASTSSLSSSSSSSPSSPWTSEPSLDKEKYLTYIKPQHSLSCSNIPEARCQLRDEESEDLDFDLGDSSLVQHHQQGAQQDFDYPEQQHLGLKRGTMMSRLHRGQSKSEEGLLQSVSRDFGSGAGGRPLPTEFNPLHKTTSLGQNLASNESTSAAVRGMGPKRAVSSIQLPNKGILKNKDEGQKKANFRKAKSMEVLSTRVQVTGPRKQSTVETMRENLVKEKLEFSAFLDEITRQVISPSRLNSFGITPSTTTFSKSPTSNRRLPTKGSKQGQECVSQPKKMQNSKPVRSDCVKTDSSSPSQPHRRGHSNKYGHNRLTESSSSPTPLNKLQHNLKKQSSTNEKYGATSHKKHQGKYSQLLTDGTSTSPEPVLQEKHHHVKHRGSSHGDHEQSKQPKTGHEHKGSARPARPFVLESESHSSKSSSATSPSSDKSQENKPTGHKRHYKHSQRDSVSTMDRVKLLEQYNRELHENLLQTVACIENMEAELQCTKLELNGFKDKYKRLQENYSTCQQANSVLEQKLQAVVDSMNSERKYHLHRIVELTKQLDTAKNTIIALENINVPSLVKEILGKHFDSKESVRSFLLSTSPGQTVTDQPKEDFGLGDRQFPAEKGEDSTSEWLLTEQKILPDRQQHVTAFLPWTEIQDPWIQSEKMEAKGSEETGARALSQHDFEESNLPLTVTDLSMAIYKNIAEANVKMHEAISSRHPLGFDTEINSICVLRPGDVPVNPYSLEEINSNRATGRQNVEGGSDNAQQNLSNSYITAQNMLETFVSQMPHPAQEGQLEKAQGYREIHRVQRNYNCNHMLFD